MSFIKLVTLGEDFRFIIGPLKNNVVTYPLGYFSGSSKTGLRADRVQIGVGCIKGWN